MNQERIASASTTVPILLVDDMPANILALQAVLAAPDREIVVAHSGRDAVRLVTQRDFAVILLDIQMPDMDGFETASQIKQVARRGLAAPIIFLTGIDSERSRLMRAYAEGAVDFIQKPIEPEIIRAKVSVFVELYRAQQRLAVEQARAEAERLRLEKETARREAAVTSLTFVRTVIDNLPELAWTAQPDGEIDFYNQRWFEFTGTTFEEMAGWGWQRVHDPTILPAVVDKWKRALATGESFEMEFPLRGGNGVFRWFLTRVRPVRDASGRIVRWFGTNTDVDESRKLREALARAAENEKRAREEAELADRAYAQLRETLLRSAQAERERLEMLFHEAPSAICLLRGQDLTIELANLQLLDLWGKTNAIVGQPLVAVLPELHGEGFDDLLRGVVKTGVTYHGKEVPARLARGGGHFQDVYFDFVCVPLRAPDGTIDGVLVHAYDVTEKVIARRRVEGLRDDAIRAVRAREDLLAIVSHDLRNPLSTVLIGAKQIEQLAGQSESGVRTKKAVTRIVNAVDRMNRLVGDLLDLAKLEAGQPLSMDREKHDVVELIRRATELLDPLARSRQLTLTTDLRGPAYVLCDSGRVQQVLANLIDNAIKFTREGGTIHVGAKRAESEILVSVRDTGVGVSDQQLPHIFQPYWQADAKRKDGAGLGLSIAKAIVETHGGRIWVETAQGSGSTFYFTLPATDATDAIKEER